MMDDSSDFDSKSVVYKENGAIFDDEETACQKSSNKKIFLTPDKTSRRKEKKSPRNLEKSPVNDNDTLMMTKCKNQKCSTNKFEEDQNSSIDQEGDKNSGDLFASIFDNDRFSDLKYFSSDYDHSVMSSKFSGKAVRRQKKRQTTRSRRLSRDKKLNSLNESNASSTQQQQILPNLDQFHSLRSLPPSDSTDKPPALIIVDEENLDNPNSSLDSECLEHYRTNESLNNDAILERLSFYQNFSLLIQAGDKAFKFHDYASSHSQDSSYGVRMKTTTTKQNLKARNSYSQDDNYVSRLSVHGSTKLKNRRTTWAAKSNRFDTGSKVNFGDILWLHLQAWKAGKSMKKDEIYQSLVEIDQRIVEKRSNSLSIFDEIKSFVVDQDGFEKETSPKSSDHQIFNDLNHWPLTFDLEVSKLSSMVKKQHLALCQVHNLLEKYHKFGNLFPDYRTFENYTTDYQTKDVFEKLQVLNVWCSIVRDIGRKMKNIGHLLELQKCRPLNPQSHWPNFEYDSPTDETVFCSLNSTPENETPASLLRNSPPIENEAAKVVSENGIASPVVVARRSLESQHQKQKRLSAFLYSDDERDASKITVYTHFVEKSLKLRGMRRALIRILKILTPTLLKVRLTLQKREYTAAGVAPSVATSRLCQKTSFSLKLDEEETYNLTKYGINHPAFRQSDLPNYYESFLFLLKIPLSLTNEWLKIRIAQKQQREPDPITLDKLIQDCRDCLTAACNIKAFYQDYVQACTEDQTLLDKLLVDDLEDFEANFYNMFDIYLEYVRLWADHQTSLHPVTTDWSQSLITHLENEWKFAKKVACNMLSGESDAAMKFCAVNNQMYRSIEDLFDEFKESLGDLTMKNVNFPYQNSQNSQTTDEEDGNDVDEEDDQNADDELDHDDREEQMNGISTQQQYGWQSGRRLDENLNQCGDDYGSSKNFQSCRLMRQYLHEIREKSLRALAFSKLLQKDLEIACKLALKCSKTEILSKLFQTNHCLIKTVNFTPEFLIFCNESVTQNEQYLQTLLNVTCGQDERLFSPNLPNKMGYLILVDCDQSDEGSKEYLSSKWMGNVRTIKPNADTNLALHNLEVDGIYFVAISSEKLIEQRSMIKKLLGSELVSFLSEQCSCHGMISEYMHELKVHYKTCALNMSSKIIWWLNLIEEYANVESDLKNDENKKHYRDVLIQAYNFAFEYHRDLCKILSGELKVDLLKNGVRKLVEKWARLIDSICDRGRGSRPRWADEGLNFLVFASDPIYTLTLEMKQFQDFKNIVNKCIEHIVGSNSPPGSARKKDRHEAAISSVTVVTEPPVHRAISWPQDKNLSSMASIARKCSVHTVKDVVDPNLDQETVITSSLLHNGPSLDVTNLNLQQRTSTKRLTRKISILRKIDHMEKEREDLLRRQKVIGRCVERQQIAPQKQIALRRANFAWQKMTNKIGAGKFGSVYTAIRLDTTVLIAVKQVKLQNQQDHQAMQSYIDEVTNFESIKHENLVRYYGVEVHRDELFIFMEFCNEGTLEKLCAEGLSEQSVRIYTLHLLKAVCELHRRNICHRDIKPANIFLSSDYTLKLGDFGSSVRLQNSTTNVGELTMHVGTPTYMAPEVCTSSQEGHGRMADIWSVGCVVLEMTTGKKIVYVSRFIGKEKNGNIWILAADKTLAHNLHIITNSEVMPPWHDLRNTWSIIWKVGNGAIPHIPDSISPDCRDFLLKCLKTKSCERSTAEQLLEHPFVKVNL